MSLMIVVLPNIAPQKTVINTVNEKRTIKEITADIQKTRKALASDYPIYTYIKSNKLAKPFRKHNIMGNLADVQDKFIAKEKAEADYYHAFDEKFATTHEISENDNFKRARYAKKETDKYQKYADILASEQKYNNLSLADARKAFVKAKAEYEKSLKTLTLSEKLLFDKALKQHDKKQNLLIDINQHTIGSKMVGLAEHVNNLKQKLNALKAELSVAQMKKYSAKIK